MLSPYIVFIVKQGDEYMSSEIMQELSESMNNCELNSFPRVYNNVSYVIGRHGLEVMAQQILGLNSFN